MALDNSLPSNDPLLAQTNDVELSGNLSWSASSVTQTVEEETSIFSRPAGSSISVTLWDEFAPAAPRTFSSESPEG